MKIPGPDHPITITPTNEPLRILVDGVVIAETAQALTLQEASYPAVQYVPRADIDMALVEKTTRSTHCPYKGDASYYTIKAGDTTLDNAAWSYEAPYPAMAQIKVLQSSDFIYGVTRAR